MKYVEQLAVQDLKKAFRNYHRMKETNEAQISREWKVFWDLLKNKCSVVERV